MSSSTSSASGARAETPSIRSSNDESAELTEGSVVAPPVAENAALAANQNESDLETEDSWSVIYSDDSNSIGALSKYGDESEGSAAKQAASSSTPSAAFAAAAKREERNSNDASSIMTLKDSGQWNGSLSIPKLSIKEDAAIKAIENNGEPQAVETKPDVDVATLAKEQTNKCMLDAAACYNEIKSKALKNCEALWFEVVAIYKQLVIMVSETPFVKENPYFKQIGIASTTVFCLMIFRFVLFPDTFSFGLYSGSADPNADTNNYLVCHDRRSIFVIERDPMTHEMTSVTNYGNPKYKLKTVATEVKLWDDLLMYPPPSDGSFDAWSCDVFGRTICQPSLLDSPRLKYTTKVSGNGFGSMIIYSEKDDFDGLKLASKYPKIRQKDIESYVGKKVYKSATTSAITSSRKTRVLLSIQNLETAVYSTFERKVLPKGTEATKAVTNFFTNELAPFVMQMTKAADEKLFEAGDLLRRCSFEAFDEIQTFYKTKGRPFMLESHEQLKQAGQVMLVQSSKYAHQGKKAFLAKSHCAGIGAKKFYYTQGKPAFEAMVTSSIKGAKLLEQNVNSLVKEYGPVLNDLVDDAISGSKMVVKHLWQWAQDAYASKKFKI